MSPQLYVFGSNGEGQLGLPAADIVDHPVKVPVPPPLEGLENIIGGYNHTLIRARSGKVYGSGDNRKGQLSGGSDDSSQTLEKFELLRNEVSFVTATSEASAYITNAEHPNSENCKPCSISTEGAGVWGELGRGHGIHTRKDYDNERGEPAASLHSPVIDLAAGVWHYVAVLADGSVYGWGKARLGQLGQQFNGQVAEPTKIEDIPFKPVRVVCGKDFTYLVGDPSTGEHIVLGKDKFGISSSKPPSVKGWKDIGATWHSIFVLFEDGTLVAWGRDTLWQLIPPDLPSIDKIAVGSEHVLALAKEGKLISWGWGKHGNCGNLFKVRDQAKNDMLNGFWNQIEIPGTIEMIAAGYCTSFVVTRNSSHETGLTQ